MFSDNIYLLNSSKLDPDNKNPVAFYSTMYVKNSLYQSVEPDKIVEFYNSFRNRDELIRWMKERPLGNFDYKIYNGDPDIAVVIPTIDHNGKYPEECRDNIFKGMTLIFVESGRNMYFNFASNVNAGIKKALTLKPKWIVISNDDMYKMDEPEKLKEELSKLDSDKINLVIPNNGDVGFISEYRKVVSILSPILKHFKPAVSIEQKFSIRYRFYLKEFTFKKKILNKIFIKKVIPVKFLGSFFILSYNYCKKLGGDVFDTIFVNGFEDIDLMVRQFIEKDIPEKIEYRIGDMGGQSLGRNQLRSGYRGIANRAYFNWKNYNKISELRK